MFTPMFHGQNRNTAGFIPPSYIPRQDYFKDVKISKNAKYISAIFTPSSGVGTYIMSSMNYGNTFIVTTPSTIGDHRHLGMSWDGKYQITGGLNTKLLMSSNYGNTFSELSASSTLNWRYVEINDDGSIMFARETGGLWKSVDYGASWNKTYDNGGSYVSISQTGQYVYIDNTTDISSSDLFISNDYGENFIDADTDGGIDDYASISTSSNGLIVASSGYFSGGSRIVTHTSYNDPFPNIEFTSSTNVSRISNIGTFIVALDSNNTYRTYSTNYGVDWSNTPSVSGSTFDSFEMAKDLPNTQVFYWGILATLANLYITTDNGINFYEIGLP